MLGWMLKRGENAPVAATEGADTTEIDQPDTPAPVFAARALKSALFGTPARPTPARPVSINSRRTSTFGEPNGSNTPPRPQGILLTPGTGTSRRKRVSFGHEVTSNASRGVQGAKQKSDKAGSEDHKDGNEFNAQGVFATQQKDDISDDEWEEEADEDNHCNHDVTIDLNEPHSQSGRYWKHEFETYQKDAKVEIGKLLKYKQMAKSYAQEKDAEAVQLAEMLRDEQQKIVKMEKRIVENASQIASSRGVDEDGAPPELLSKLTKQTALVVQYRSRIHDLENQLATLLVDKEEEPEMTGRRRRQLASPRTQKTLLETQRELRRARNQVKELNDLREQVAHLKVQLKQAERKNSPTNVDKATEAVAAQLEEAREVVKRKDEQLRQLQMEFDVFRKESEAHNEDTKAVLERAHGKIADLKKEVRSLKATNSERPRPSSWHPQAETAPQTNDQEPSLALMSGGLTEGGPLAIGARRKFASAINDSIEVNLSDVKGQTLRDKFQEGASENPRSRVMESPAQRPKLEQPRWQPFVPRSPRNRAYLGEVLSERMQNAAAVSAATKPKDIIAPDLPALGRALSRSDRLKSHSEDEVDLVENGFARLGGPDVDGYANGTILANTSKSAALPPERRAAAIARIERRMAEKKRAQKDRGFDKENVRP
ncbi:hypothetical protein HJFPF1_11464 [Paramyrothecium foliicola]|nr:hypothetical protein HJFPF1_11464 [Paramyrothecium foliicola]